LLDLAQIYEQEHVLADGRAPALWRKCTCRAEWAGFPDDWKPRRAVGGQGNGGIVFPWIGRNYEPGGVVVLGINLRDASGLYVEYEIAARQLEVLAAGGYKVHNSWWAYRSARSAAAALRSLAGADEFDIENPSELAPVLDATARLQAVKCSSRDGARSARTAEMNANCPPRYLARALAVLRPAVLVSFGLETWYAIERIGQVDESIGGEHFSRSTVCVEGIEFEMVWLHHPAAVGRDAWRLSHELLLDNLHAQPIGSQPRRRRRSSPGDTT
jgi:hypothetical protein